MNRLPRPAIGAAIVATLGLVLSGCSANSVGNSPSAAPSSDSADVGSASPSPSPDVSGPSVRPLVYGAGKTVHMGDQDFNAGTTVAFLDATDDGVVFLTQKRYGEHPSETLWFYDGSTTEAMGELPTAHIGVFEVWTANPGSLVVWADATSSNEFGPQRLIVYDTSRHEVVAQLPSNGIYNSVLYVDDQQIFFNSDSRTHLLRYDVASGETQKISRASFEAVLSTRDRMLKLAEDRGDTGTVFTERAMARFNQVGRRLVPVDSNGDPTVFRLATGEPLVLRVAPGYKAPGDEMSVVQWLDDDRFVLFPNKGEFDAPPEVGDLLICHLPDGRCRVAVGASSTRYVAPS